MSKHERRVQKHQLKKQQMQVESKTFAQKAKSVNAIKLAVAAIAILAVAFLAFGWFSSLGGAPSIQVTPARASLGKVSVAGGTMETVFSLSNTGASDLVLTGIVTSCMCTSAILVVDGVESPRFGMHEGNPGWQQAIKPGQEAELKVFYDPKVHPEMRGAVTRTISITNNDPLFGVKTVSITAEQVD